MKYLLTFTLTFFSLYIESFRVPPSLKLKQVASNDLTPPPVIDSPCSINMDDGEVPWELEDIKNITLQPVKISPTPFRQSQMLVD
jgi:hypothetical protein